jgi:hypothetical protein
MSAKTKAAVTKHGRNLLAVFPTATERDPVKLCKKLRRLEREAHAEALRWRNGTNEYDEAEHERRIDAVLTKVNEVLGNAGGAVPTFVNTDPRGYALKVRESWQRERRERCLPYFGHQDWGGYGIIAPDLTAGE